MKMIGVPHPGGGDVWVSLSQITYLKPRSNDEQEWTEIGFHGNAWTTTSLSVDEFIELIERA